MKNFWLFVILLCHFAWGKETYILAIHSYHEAYPWTKDQRTGFRETLNKTPGFYPLFSAEYLDTKRRSYDSAYENEFVHYMKSKYKGYRPDIIYVTDDNALKFIVNNRDKLFPSAPVIFSGVNDLETVDKLPKNFYTGVYEKKELLPNIKLIQQLFPQEREVLILGDGSSTSQIIRADVDAQSAAIGSMKFRYLNEEDFETAAAQLKAYKGKAVVLTSIGGFRTKKGDLIPLREAIDVLIHSGDHAVFSLENTFIQRGVIGGHCDDGLMQGREAAKLALKILTHPQRPLPGRVSDTNGWLFDAEALEKNGIALPREIARQSRFLNRPETFYQKHAEKMSVLLYVLVGLMGLGSLVFLRYLVYSRRVLLKSEKEYSLVVQRLNKAQEITHIGNWEWDIRKNTLWWSDEIYRIFGLVPQEFAATYGAFLERVHPDDREAVQEAVGQSLSSNADYRIVHRVVQVNGRLRYVLEEGQIERGADGEPVKMTGTVHDITEQKAIESRLKEKEEQLEMLAQAIKQSDDLIKIVNKKGLIIFVNESMKNHSGYTESELIGAHTRMFKSGRHDQSFYQKLWDTVLSGETFRDTFVNRKKDGTLFYEEESITPVVGDKGAVEYFVSTGKDITSRVEIEKALRTSEANFRNIFDNSSDGIIIHDTHGIVLEVNRAKCERLGYAKEELIGHNITLIENQNAPENIPAVIHMLRKGGHAIFEGEHQRKDGTTVPVEVHAAMITYEEEPAVLSVVRDISERKAAEIAIREAEELYHTMFTLSPVGILLVDPQTGKAVEFNKNTHETLGYTAEEFAGLHVSDYEAMESPEETAAHMEHLMAGHVERFETHHRTKEGKILDVVVVVQLISLRGKPYLFSVFQDVTALKQSAKELQTLSLRLSLATQAASMGVWEWDLSTNTLTWDDQMHALYGIDKKGDVVNYALWHDAVEAIDIGEAEASLQRAIEGRAEYDTQFWIRLPNEERRFIKAMGTVERNGEGEAVRVVGVNWDITKQKEYEEALEEAKRSAEAANIAKSNFLANMSHEIRTPMNAILGLTQLTRSLELSEQAKDYLGKIQKSSELLLHIINDILDFSKIEANRLEITPAPFDLNGVVDQMSALFGPKADAKGIEFTIKIAPKIPARLICDSLRLSQILNNLVSNAIKFTHSGEVRIFISELKRERDKITLRFTVKDTGIGIAAKDHHKLFGTFSQVDGSITREYGGSGLGLSISKRLAEIMGGKIEFTSEEGKGSTFTYIGEFGIVDDQPVEFADSPLKKGLDVLVVDDQQSAREIVKEMLTQWHCHVDEAENAQEGLAKVQQRLQSENPYELLIVDWSMPGINGIEMVKELRKIEQEYHSGHLHLVMMVTAYSQDIVIQGVTDEEAVDAFLNKPVTYSSLYDALNNVGLYSKIGSPVESSDNFIAITAPIRGASVLLVEDNEINIQVESDFLRQMGLDVTVVTDGLQAVELLEKRRFDAVLMDYQMPVMDGIEATETIRRRGDESIIIAMTAAAMQGDKERCLSAGMNDYLTKPIDIIQMAQVLVRWIPPREQIADAISVAPLPQIAELPEKIEGVDLDAGLKNCANNPELYIRTLKQFSNYYTQECTPLHEMLRQHQYEEAKRWVHTLKGTSATIGANGVYAQSLVVESEPQNEVEVETLCTLLAALCEGLEELDKTSSAEAGTFDFAIAMEQLEVIIQKLQNDQLVEHHSVETLKRVLGDYLRTSDWLKLQEALENFEYDAAYEFAVSLRRLMEKNHEPKR